MGECVLMIESQERWLSELAPDAISWSTDRFAPHVCLAGAGTP
jgi:hypothetical protein